MEEETQNSSGGDPMTNHKKIAIVTGASPGGVGFYSARGLVQHGFEVHLAGRSLDKAKESARMINEEEEEGGEREGEGGGENLTGKGRARARAIADNVALDLASLDSVRKYAKLVMDDPDIKQYGLAAIICNAGNNTYPERGKRATEDGFDFVFQSNALGHMLLLKMILSTLRNYFALTQDRAKVVMLSSLTHRFPDPSTIHQFADKIESSKREQYRANKEAYATSKLACHVLAQELQGRYPDELRCVPVNPGGVATNIWRNYSSTSRNLMSWVFLTPEQGAATSIAGVVGGDDEVPDGCYLTPYFVPHALGRFAMPFDAWGAFMGSRTGPSAPSTEDPHVREAVWKMYETIA